MELQWNKTPCPYMHTQLRQTQMLEETMEYRLPEEMPDVGRVLFVWGQCIIRNKQYRNDGVQLSGGVNISVLYLPEDGTAMRCTECWMPFQTKWNSPPARRETDIRISCFLSGVDARTLSARKMMLRAEVGLLGEIFEMAETEVYTPGELPEGVEVLTNVYPAVLPREVGEKTFALEDELHIPGVSQWINFALQPECEECNVVGSRIVMRGNGQLSYVYLDHNGDICTGTMELPFAHFADLNREYPGEAMADVMLCVSAMEHETENDRLRIRCTVTAQYLIKERVFLEIAEDAYRPAYDLLLHTQQLKLPMELEDRVEVLEACPAIQNGQVLDMVFLPEQPREYREGNQLSLELGGNFCWLYQDIDGQLQSQTEHWSTTLTMPAAENTRIHTHIATLKPAENGVQMTLNLQTWADQQIPMICALTLGESKTPEEGRPSLIIRPMDTDSLWKLAKETGSTMAAIRQANRLTQEPAQGQMLLIPVI